MMRYIVLILSLFFSVAGFGQGQMFLRSTPAGGGPANLLLDDYPGAAAAYAVMKLDNDYAGSCLRVRRDSDSAEQDIGFSGNDIDEASINSFCSGANCFVKTWYDQSGNGNNATQTTTANQPKVYDSSTGIIYTNSIVSIDFNGTTSALNTTSAITATNDVISIHIVTTPEKVNSDRQKILYNIQFTGNWYGIAVEMRALGALNKLIAYGNTSIVYGGNNVLNMTQDKQELYSIQLQSGTSNFYIDSGLVDSFSSGMVSSPLTAQISSAVHPYDGKIQAIIVYNSDQSANRTGIETIINNYFSIF